MEFNERIDLATWLWWSWWHFMQATSHLPRLIFSLRFSIVFLTVNKDWWSDNCKDKTLTDGLIDRPSQGFQLFCQKRIFNYFNIFLWLQIQRKFYEKNLHPKNAEIEIFSESISIDQSEILLLCNSACR